MLVWLSHVQLAPVPVPVVLAQEIAPTATSSACANAAVVPELAAVEVPDAGEVLSTGVTPTPENWRTLKVFRTVPVVLNWTEIVSVVARGFWTLV